jgi:hypothetical protein
MARNLISSREIGGITYVWLVDRTQQPAQEGMPV